MGEARPDRRGSASATPPERARALRTGCDDFLAKPYTLSRCAR